MTEEEAFTKYCVQYEGGTCTGSNCMAWRWYSKSNSSYMGWTEEQWLYAAVEVGGSGYTNRTETRRKWLQQNKVNPPIVKGTAGYCGLVKQT